MTPTHTSQSHARLSLCLILVAALAASAIAPGARAAIVIPTNPTTAFIQTTGPNAGLNIGDYRTNILGDNLPHEIAINIACTPGRTYAFQIFDPAIDLAGNPPGFGTDGVTERVRDELRGAADNTTHQLISPNGTLVANTTYAPGTSDAAWTTLATVTTTGTPGVDCGTYTLRSSTATDDDNAWRFRLWGGNPALPEAFDPFLGPDGVQDTGDESYLGILAVSYQHDPAGCQNFYWFVPDSATNLYMLAFDLDNATSIGYLTPGGTNIAGTLSGFTVWNDTPPQQQARPVYANMSTFDVGIGDLTGDATANPEPGLWQATICVPIDNQYSFEVPGYPIYLDRPLLPAVTINKDDGVTTVPSPGVTTYTLTIRNNSQAAAMPIPGPEVVDTLPAGMSFVSCAVNAPLVGSCAESAPGSGIVNFNLQAQLTTSTTLAYLPGAGAAPNNVGTLTVVANVAPGLAIGTALTNTATVDFTDIYGNDHPPVSASDTDTVIGADMSIVKADQPDPVIASQTLTYTLQVSNAGPAVALNVTVADTLPAGLTFVSATPPQASGPNPLAWNLGSFAVGESRTITVVTTVDPALPAGVITNTATVTSTTPDPNPTNNRDDEPTRIFPLPAADLSIVKADFPDPVVGGQSLTYTLLVHNAGPSDAQNTVVADTLPAGVTFVSATPPQASGPNPLTWNLGTLAAGSSRAITIVVTVDPSTQGTITNTTTITSTTPDPDPSDNDDEEPTRVTPLADVSVVKGDQPDPVVAGAVLTYTLRVANAGPSNAQNTVVADTLPAGVTFVSATPPQASGPNPLTWNLGTLAAGSSRAITIVVTVDPSTQGTITNTTTITSTTPDPDPSDNDDEEPTRVTPLADVSVVKGDEPDPVAAGAVLTYTLRVANAGPSNARNVMVTDTLPAGVAFVSVAPGAPICSGAGNRVTCALGTLAVRASTTLTIVTRVDIATSGEITNTAIVRTSTPDPNPNNDTDEEPTTVRPGTAVELLYFRVDGVNGQTVRLAWATAEEIDNFGFNLYRAPTGDFSRAVLIHFEPSAIGGSGSGATYGYSDTPPQEGAWWYWLADLDTQGHETVHAPVSAAVGPNALPHRAYLPLVQK